MTGSVLCSGDLELEHTCRSSGHTDLFFILKRKKCEKREKVNGERYRVFEWDKKNTISLKSHTRVFLSQKHIRPIRDLVVGCVSLLWKKLTFGQTSFGNQCPFSPPRQIWWVARDRPWLVNQDTESGIRGGYGSTDSVYSNLESRASVHSSPKKWLLLTCGQ